MAESPPSTATVVIVAAKFPQDVDTVKALFEAYAASLGIDLGFQSFEQELAGLPGRYSPENGGALLLAKTPTTTGRVVGCVALRAMEEEKQQTSAATPHDDGDERRRGYCEMKRLYVDPSARGSGTGRRLIDAVLDTARAMGYSGMKLDTLSDMRSARAIYEGLGFYEVPPYYHNPTPGVVYLEKRL